ncbi:hypothetical protein F5884DRAFT_76111 [Xylogone sp. PMI_703]|nr:hypothetical protein F5884DRAFT_76111 [Xylogone sp. PMI_703]
MFGIMSSPVHIHPQNHTFSPIVSSPLSWQSKSSPLSPHNTNCSHQFYNHMTSPTPSSRSKSPHQSTETPFSKRTIKPNPLLQRSGSDGREARRKLFLKKVRSNSEDKRWEKRGGEDEMMRTIWIAEQRRLAEKQAREAMAIPSEREEEELEILNALTDARTLDEIMADEVARKEEEELEALLSLMNEPDMANAAQNQQNRSSYDTAYGSDEEDYDLLFENVIQNEVNGIHDSQQQENTVFDHDMMDMS